MAASPIYEELKSKLKMTVSNGSQEATDFDLFILDGDGFSGEQLSSDKLIREAVHSGVWVLALDVMEDDKDGLGEILHESSQGDVGAYLVRQAENSDGRLGSRLIDFVNPDRKAEDVAQSVVEYIIEQAVTPQQADIPPRAELPRSPHLGLLGLNAECDRSSLPAEGEGVWTRLLAVRHTSDGHMGRRPLRHGPAQRWQQSLRRLPACCRGDGRQSQPRPARSQLYRY